MNRESQRRDAEQAAHIHDELQAWLTKMFPTMGADVIVTALTFEIARIVAVTLSDDVDLDAVLQRVAANMKRQINAHRSGELKT